MDNIDFKKLIVIFGVGTVVISTLVSVLVVGFLNGGLSNIFRPTIFENAPLGTKEVSEHVVRQDELVVSVVDRANPAVVSIVASKDVPVIEQYQTDPFSGTPFENDPFFKQFFGDNIAPQIPQYQQKGTKKQDISAGSGFVVSGDGIIITNKHVVEDTEASYTVLFNDGTKVPAKILARDPLQDFAIVKVDKTGLISLPLGRSSVVKIGQSVIAIGNALGEFRNTVSVGVISGLHRNITAGGAPSGTEDLQELMQTDAAINPGNSGGPLLNLYGEVIGIDTAVAEGAQSIGFAIPIDQIKRSLRDVETNGKITYPFLGVRYIVITSDLKKTKNLAVDYGVLISKGENGEEAIAKGSPAEKAGLKVGDIIEELAGKKITQDNTLSSIVEKHSVGEIVVIKVLRDGKELIVNATLTERKF